MVLTRSSAALAALEEERMAPPLNHTTNVTTTITSSGTSTASRITMPLPPSADQGQASVNYNNRPPVHPIKKFDGKASVVQWLKSYLLYIIILKCAEQIVISSFSYYLENQ